MLRTPFLSPRSRWMEPKGFCIKEFCSYSSWGTAPVQFVPHILISLGKPRCEIASINGSIGFLYAFLSECTRHQWQSSSKRCGRACPWCLVEYVLEEMFIILNLDGWVTLNQENIISKLQTQTQISSVIKLCLDSKVFLILWLPSSSVIQRKELPFQLHFCVTPCNKIPLFLVVGSFIWLKNKYTYIGTIQREKWSSSVVSNSATPWAVACNVPLSMGFTRQECWSRLPFPSPEDLPNPGTEPRSPALQADSLLDEPGGKSTGAITQWNSYKR